jgi:hypothetical protein
MYTELTHNFMKMSVSRMVYGLRTTLMAVVAATMLLMAPVAASAAKSANDCSHEFYEDALRWVK